MQIIGTGPSIGFHYPGNTIAAIGLFKDDTSHNTFRFRAINPNGDGLAGVDVEGPAYFGTGGSGNVGIGTTVPGERLEVNGKIKLSANTGGSIIFADTTVQSTAWTGTLTGGDYAESVDVTGPRNSYEAGDLLVIDADHPGNFLKSSQPYSTLIGGVYATKPGVTGRRQPKEKLQDENYLWQWLASFRRRSRLRMGRSRWATSS